MDKKLGEHLARLALARDALLQVRRTARRLARPYAHVAERLLDTVNEQIAAATKSNAMVQGRTARPMRRRFAVAKRSTVRRSVRAFMQVYHETVPKAAALPPLPSLSSALVAAQLPAAPRADDASSCLAPADVAAYWLVPAASLGSWRACQDKVAKAIETMRRRCDEMEEALDRYGRARLGPLWFVHRGSHGQSFVCCATGRLCVLCDGAPGRRRCRAMRPIPRGQQPSSSAGTARPTRPWRPCWPT